MRWDGEGWGREGVVEVKGRVMGLGWGSGRRRGGGGDGDGRGRGGRVGRVREGLVEGMGRGGVG